MDVLEREMRKTREKTEYPAVDPEHVKKTVQVSRQAFARQQAQDEMSGIEFLFRQFRYIQKRWWILQGGVLMFLWYFMFIKYSDGDIPIELALFGPLFGIMIIPELWKNRNVRSLEIENAAYFTLRKVYTARFLLFGIIDLLLCSFFFSVTIYTLQVSIYELIALFLIPFNVTCGICFAMLCSRKQMSEFLTVSLSLIWGAIWSWFTSIDSIRGALTEPVWIFLLAASLGILLIFGYKAWKNSRYECEALII